MRAYRKMKKCKKYFLSISCLMIIGLILVDLRLRPIIYKVSSYQSQNFAQSLIAENISEEMMFNNFTYTDFVVITRDYSEKISSVEMNMPVINDLYNSLTNSLNDEFFYLKTMDLEIPLGTLTGYDFFYGRGPTLNFKLDPVGKIITNIESKITSVGINQTLHEIILTVDFEMNSIIPGFSQTVNSSADYILASTIIVGEIPESYFDIGTLFE